MPAGLLALGATLLLAGCATGGHPVLYPDDRGAGPDIADCMQRARAAGANAGQGQAVARDTALGAAAGGVASGVYGAVRGTSDAAQSAAAGAAVGASLGLLRGVARGTEPTPIFKAYVQRCLAERGYDVIGWR